MAGHTSKKIGQLSRGTWSPGLVRSVAAVCGLVSGVLLFGPWWLVVRMGLDDFVFANHAAIGICVQVSVATLFVTWLLPWLGGVITRKVTDWRGSRRGRKRLRTLSRSERNILNQYLSRQRRTLVLDANSGATVALQQAGIICPAGDREDAWSGLTFVISPWAWNMITTNPRLVQVHDSTLTHMSDWRGVHASRRQTGASTARD